MTPEEAAEYLGKEVVYCPYPGAPIEVGVLTSINTKWAFVRYGDGETSAATRYDHLYPMRLEDPVPPSPVTDEEIAALPVLDLAELQERAEYEGWDGPPARPELTETNRLGHAFVYRPNEGGSYADQRAAWRQA